MIQRCKATIGGIVQGIGFRPFIYKLAHENNLRGYVLNTGSGVELEVEGEPTQIESFFQRLESNHLPLAQITSIQKIVLPPVQYQNFTIRQSLPAQERTALISPDICICEDCRRELFDPRDRRYRYPFINCTNCGPRYTIIQDIPYDRPNTSMGVFEMCALCQAEYDDPANRRFHAQPNACPVCGPQVTLYAANQQPVTTDDPILTTIELLKAGFIVAVKGLGGFHLAVNAEDNDALLKLRQRKNREEKPLALMSLNLKRVREYALISPAEEVLLNSPQRPIVLLRKKQPNPIAPAVAPHNQNFGVMLPYTPLHYLLLDHDLLALVMTSANMSEEPIVIDNQEAFRRLGQIADYFLLHNRDIILRSDDSIVRQFTHQTTLLRRSRGYVPRPIFLKKALPPILGCGAELKNTICLTRGQNAFLSQHIGDLKNLESYQFFQLTIEHLKRILDIHPHIIAYDLHPDYLSTRYALEQPSVDKIAVQHHHAHIVSGMAENNLSGPVLGLAFDGTGYGIDGKIWGGEVLLVESADFNRLAHLDYVPLPGAEAAIQEPWRMALSYLNLAFGDELSELPLPFLKKIDPIKIKIVLQMLNQRINSPETSSLGRLFDAVSAILGLCERVSFEGQAAITLEMIQQDTSEHRPYRFEWYQANGIYLISPQHLIQQVTQDVLAGTPPAIISARFHLTLIQLFTAICLQLRQDTGLKRVVLSGGVFQNATLLTGLQNALTQEKFQVYVHSQVPPNDGGISLGQVAIAEAAMEK